MLGLGLGPGFVQGKSLGAQIAALFKNGEQGAWYDPSDFSTLWQDAAGTTPVTAVEQPVGLMLDKRLTKGPVLATALNFVSSVSPAWTPSSLATVTSESTFSLTNAGGVSRAGLVTPGKSYEIEIDYSLTQPAEFWLCNPPTGITSTNTVLVRSAVASASVRAIFKADNDILYFRFSVATNVSITRYSIREIPGNHALQATAASRPTLSARVNLFTATEAIEGAGWVKARTGGADGPTVVASTTIPPPEAGRAVVEVDFGAVPGRYVRQVLPFVSGAVGAVSVWAYSPTVGGSPSLLITSNNTAAWGTGISQKFTLTPGWQRLVLSGALIASGSSVALHFGGADAAGSGDPAIIGKVYLSQPQLELGSTPTRYQRVGPLRNLLTKTDEFTHPTWGGNNLFTANTDLAPDGTYTADRKTLVATGTAVTQTIFAGATAASQSITASFHVKQGTAATFDLLIRNGNTAINWARMRYTWATGTYELTSGAGTGVVVSVSNGFVRASLTSSGSVTAGDALIAYIYGCGVAGQIGETAAVWGGQFEYGSTLTDYERVDTAATTYDTVGFPVGLRCDGVDDGMVTSAINFTSTDKMTVWAAVRKMSDAGVGAVVELSAAVTANAGAFGVFAPVGPFPTFGARANGSANAGKNTPANYPSPRTALLTLLADTSLATVANEVVLRVDGAVPSGMVESGANCGSGNFGNYPLYLFRRGGVSESFNGLFYGLIIRGAATPLADIQKGERFLAGKSGTLALLGVAPPYVPAPPVNTVAPVITGTPTEGQTLGVNVGTWANSPTSYTYQWQSSVTTSGFAIIPGATNPTLPLTSEYNTKYIRLYMRGVNADGQSDTVLSNFVGPIAAAPPAGMSVLQATPLVTKNASTSVWVLAFPSGVTAGSRLYLGVAAATSDAGTATFGAIMQSIAMTGVVWSKVQSRSFDTTKGGAELWEGVVNTGGATDLTITHAPNSHSNLCAIEVTPAGTVQGTPSAVFAYNDATHDWGTVNFGAAKTGIALAVTYVDPWTIAAATFTPPGGAGWVKISEYLAGSGNPPQFWFGYKLLAAESSVSGIITVGPTTPVAVASILTAYAV